MLRVSVFPNDCRILLTGVPAEAGGAVVVAAEADIIELHLGAIGENSPSLRGPLENGALLRI